MRRLFIALAASPFLSSVNPLMAGASWLAGVAMWADTMRSSDPERFSTTSRWHFVNVAPDSCRFVASRDSKDGACVIEAIETQRRLLIDPTQSFDVRRDALKFIVHFVGCCDVQ
jgi:hypothetical protein